MRGGARNKPRIYTAGAQNTENQDGRVPTLRIRENWGTRCRAPGRESWPSIAIDLEVDDDACGDARAVGAVAGCIEADIVHLGTEGQVRKESNIDSATEAVRELAVGTAAATDGDAGPADETLDEGSEICRIVQRNARAEEIGVGIDGNAGRRSMIAAEVADQA